MLSRLVLVWERVCLRGEPLLVPLVVFSLFGAFSVLQGISQKGSRMDRRGRHWDSCQLFTLPCFVSQPVLVLSSSYLLASVSPGTTLVSHKACKGRKKWKERRQGLCFPLRAHSPGWLPSHWALRSASFSLRPSDKRHVLVPSFKILGENLVVSLPFNGTAIYLARKWNIQVNMLGDGSCTFSDVYVHYCPLFFISKREAK